MVSRAYDMPCVCVGCCSCVITKPMTCLRDADVELYCASVREVLTCVRRDSVTRRTNCMFVKKPGAYICKQVAFKWG